MNPILIDTNAYTSLRRGDPQAISIVQRAPFIAINSTVVGELLGGFKAGTREIQNRQDLESFLSSPRVALHPIDRGTAEQYAAIYAALRTAGSPIPTNDIWIAATAIQHSLRLFTFDNHFKAVQGLRAGASLAELSAP